MLGSSRQDPDPRRDYQRGATPVPVYWTRGNGDVLTALDPHCAASGGAHAADAGKTCGHQPGCGVCVRIGAALPVGRHALSAPRGRRLRGPNAPRCTRHARACARRGRGVASSGPGRSSARPRAPASRTSHQRRLNSTLPRSPACSTGMAFGTWSSAESLHSFAICRCRPPSTSTSHRDETSATSMERALGTPIFTEPRRQRRWAMSE